MKVQWLEGKYGALYLYPVKGNRDLCVTLCWDSTRPRTEVTAASGYKVSFAGITLTARPASTELAKTLGERLARKVLTAALDNLQ